jgi:hypothetical protein
VSYHRVVVVPRLAYEYRDYFRTRRTGRAGRRHE